MRLVLLCFVLMYSQALLAESGSYEFEVEVHYRFDLKNLQGRDPRNHGNRLKSLLGKPAFLLFSSPTGELLQVFETTVPAVVHYWPVEGEITGCTLNPSWRPTDGTREAYKRKNGVELPADLPPHDERNAMGIGKLSLHWFTLGPPADLRIHNTNTILNKLVCASVGVVSG